MRCLPAVAAAILAVVAGATEAPAQRMRGSTPVRVAEPFNRGARTGTPARTATAMAGELRQELGRSRVVIRTPRVEQRIDLTGSGHFDKSTGRRIATPHVHTIERGGQRTTRPAEKADIRNARRVARASTSEKGK